MNAQRTRQTTRRPHPDRPDTEADLDLLAVLPQGAERARAEDRVIRAWLPMAKRLARRYRERGEDLEDLEQVASLGLIKAVQRFDPGLGHAFESYAVPVITGEIKRHFRDHAWDLHVPRRVQELRNAVRTAVRQLEADPQSGAPTPERIAHHLGIEQSEVERGLEAMESFRSLSLDAGSDAEHTDRRPLADTLSTTEPGYELVVEREAVTPALRRLSERERHILYLRFYREMAQSHIARELGVSQMHISRILRSICTRVRRDAGLPEPGRAPESVTAPATARPRPTPVPRAAQPAAAGAVAEPLAAGPASVATAAGGGRRTGARVGGRTGARVGGREPARRPYAGSADARGAVDSPRGKASSLPARCPPLPQASTAGAGARTGVRTQRGSQLPPPVGLKPRPRGQPGYAADEFRCRAPRAAQAVGGPRPTGHGTAGKGGAGRTPGPAGGGTAATGPEPGGFPADSAQRLRPPPVALQPYRLRRRTNVGPGADSRPVAVREAAALVLSRRIGACLRAHGRTRPPVSTPDSLPRGAGPPEARPPGRRATRRVRQTRTVPRRTAAP
ncbi:SigB/SigF/SigG family RNA polymerase sigma factor [Streptomyces sp. P38-E01]|uniref:SigB/SigF/SigG family RNA polymerase sigma factor n=1 Tax=Streptomyces tardus TaxID=2780544 RepID=A0A949N099_9ACTN|nr:SigB/SigF/SigG family RNA polymerase sigma factor [Streptomyces tardus]MBU7596435.1 SigB/SigF/SigG family RNA polymerase sigma factor [Streptomyces tardus]